MKRFDLEHRIGARVLEAVATWKRTGFDTNLGTYGRALLDYLGDVDLDTDEIEAAAERMANVELDPMHTDGKCRCAGEGRCDWCLRQRQNAIAADLAIIVGAAMRANDAEVVDAARRLDHAADALIVDLASVLAVVHVIGKSLADAEAERDRWAARVKLVEGRIDAAAGVLRGTALAAVDVFADAGCTSDEIDEAITFLDPNGNADVVDDADDPKNHGYRVPQALARIAAALRRRGQ